MAIMEVLSVFFFLLGTVMATSQGSDYYSSCLSWRLAVETNNIIGWKAVPKKCGEYVQDYMIGNSHQYRKDSKAVVDEAIRYARSLKLPRDGRNIWIFDVDETSLSHLPYFAEHEYGTEPLNATSFIAWIKKAKAQALPESLRLYKKLLSLGIEVVFLTERTEDLRKVTEINLQNAGYYTWEQLILKGLFYPEDTAQQVYKSNERRTLEEIQSYRIVGNIGDQWSDIQGLHAGYRTFKLPNPMYYEA